MTFKISTFIRLIGLLALSTTLIAGGIGCSKAGTNGNGGKQSAQNLTISGVLEQGSVNITTTTYSGEKSNTAQTPLLNTGLSGLTQTPLTGYQLYCVTFATPPTAGTGKADASGNVTISFNALDTPFGCFVLDPSGHSVATLMFTSTTGGQFSQTVSFSGNANVGIIIVDLTSGVGQVTLPSNGTIVPTPQGGGSSLQTFPAGSTPDAIAIDNAGNIWVANYGSNNVTELNPAGTTIGTFGVGYNPQDLAIDSSGNVWVTNFGSTYVTELSSTGITIGTYTVNGGPSGLAIDSSGNVWVVVNNGLNNVTKLSPTGSIIGTYAVGKCPQTIAIDGSGNGWVTNMCDGTVSELSPSGTTIGTYPVGNDPASIAIDGSGNIWVTHFGMNTLTKLDPAGATMGTYTVNCGTGIAIDNAGNVWVTGNGGLTQLSTAGTTITTYSNGGGNSIAIDSSGDIWAAIEGNNSVTKKAGVAPGPQYFPYKGPQFAGGGNY